MNIPGAKHINQKELGKRGAPSASFCILSILMSYYLYYLR